ncbi:hypothetical protein ABMA28_001282 [Loxostege sticticalis]|uniref:Major facilitator superfamily (MFS) profile domain-containing protein n=1 Tax=Loxostege sticticalis TaxID=481309 RepID=A0ABD0T1B9_LOXSC
MGEAFVQTWPKSLGLIEIDGHGKFNYIVLLTCGLILMYTMVESLGVGYIISSAECDLLLTPNEKGMINAAAFIGILSTAIFWGYLSDRYGRRATMLPSIAIGTVVSFCSSLSANFVTLFVLRFFTGCMVSASSATVFAYLGEMHSDSRRSSAIAYGSTFIAFTFIILPTMAWLILRGHWSFSIGSIKMVPWRVYIWSWCVPGITAALILLFLPESPRFLFAVKGQDKALPVLASIYAWNNKKKREDYPVRSTSGLYTWMPHILNEMLENVKEPISMCDAVLAKVDVISNGTCSFATINSMVFPVSMIMGALCAATYLICGYLMKTRSKICIYSSILTVCCAMLGVSYVVPQQIVAMILFVFGVCCGCVASVLAAIAVEVFPTCVRALALCTLYMSGRLGAAVGANLIGLGLRHHCLAVMFVITLVTAGSTLLMYLWPDPKSVRTYMEGKGFAY